MVPPEGRHSFAPQGAPQRRPGKLALHSCVDFESLSCKQGAGAPLFTQYSVAPIPQYSLRGLGQHLLLGHGIPPKVVVPLRMRGAPLARQAVGPLRDLPAIRADSAIVEMIELARAARFADPTIFLTRFPFTLRAKDFDPTVHEGTMRHFRRRATSGRIARFRPRLEPRSRWRCRPRAPQGTATVRPIA